MINDPLSDPPLQIDRDTLEVDRKVKRRREKLQFVRTSGCRDPVEK